MWAMKSEAYRLHLRLKMGLERKNKMPKVGKFLVYSLNLFIEHSNRNSHAVVEN